MHEFEDIVTVDCHSVICIPSNLVMLLFVFKNWAKTPEDTVKV